MLQKSYKYVCSRRINNPVNFRFWRPYSDTGCIKIFAKSNIEIFEWRNDTSRFIWKENRNKIRLLLQTNAATKLKGLQCPKKFQDFTNQKHIQGHHHYFSFQFMGFKGQFFLLFKGFRVFSLEMENHILPKIILQKAATSSPCVLQVYINPTPCFPQAIITTMAIVIIINPIRISKTKHPNHDLLNTGCFVLL